MSHFAALIDDDFNAEPAHEHSEHGLIRCPQDAMRFLTAGKATVTLVSKTTQTRFTYKINKSDDGQMLFVSTLTGADNVSSFTYLGHIKPTQMIYWHGRKSKISADALSARAFDWAFRQLAKRVMPETLEVWHEGKCGRCGRKLTVPESISSGFGPECASKIAA